MKALDRSALADLLDARAADDELAAAAYELFGRGVFPFAGVFLDPDGLARGPLSESLRSGDLSGLRAWVAPFCCAVADVGGELADAVVDAVVAEAARAGAAAPTFGPSLDPDDPSVGVARIVDWLATPMRCGIFLSAPALERLGRALDVPRGFGPRRRLLGNLLRTGTQYGAAPDVVRGIRGLADGHAVRLSSAPWSTELADASAPWAERLAETSALLTRIEEQLRGR